MPLPSSVRRLVAPPVPMPPAARRALRGLLLVAMAAGYQGSVTSAALTYAADSWGSGTRAQSAALAVIRADVVLTLLVVRAADRVGRRRMLTACAVGAPLLTATCALAPGIAWFTAGQVLARSLVTATAILVSVLAVEQLPAGARAWASGVVVAVAACGSAVTLLLVPFAGSGLQHWRVLYLVPLLSLPAVLRFRRLTPESDRFRLHEQRRERRAPSSTDWWATLTRRRRRLFAVCAFLALVALQSTPTRQLQNEFLRTERSFSPSQVALFGLLTNVPGLVGLLVGSRVTDQRGRRRVLGIGIVGYALCDGAMFLSHGAALWTWSVLGSLLGGAVLPGIGIFVAELFPTAVRSTANGITTLLARVGGVLGLLWVALAGGSGHTGRALATTTIAPLVAVVVLLALVPETAGRELEVLNPDDAPDDPVREQEQSSSRDPGSSR